MKEKDLIDAGEQVREWTAERNRLIIAWVEKGMTYRRAAELSGISQAAVGYIVKPRKKKGKTNGRKR